MLEPSVGEATGTPENRGPAGDFDSASRAWRAGMTVGWEPYLPPHRGPQKRPLSPSDPN